MKISNLKRVFAACVLIASGLMAVHAEEARLVITTKSGTTAEFLIADSPVITYQDNILNVTGGGSEISVEADAVGSFDFVPSEGAGIDTVLAEGSRFSGLRPGSRVQVFSSDGRLVSAFIADDSETVSVNINALAPGIYIISTPDVSFKIKK